MDAKSQEIFNKHFDYCKLYLKPCDGHCNQTVCVIDMVWKGVDRPNVVGWIHHNAKTAQRMVKAVYAGVVFDKVTLCVDVNKRTYISAVSNVYWKHASADLKKLGF